MARIAITIASLLIAAGCHAGATISALMGGHELDDYSQRLDGREVEYNELPKWSLALQLMYPAGADGHGRGLWVGGEFANVSYAFEERGGLGGDLAATSLSGRVVWQEPVGSRIALWLGGVGGLVYTAADTEASSRSDDVGLAAGFFVGVSLTPRRWNTSLIGEVRRTWSLIEDVDVSGYGFLAGIRVSLE